MKPRYSATRYSAHFPIMPVFTDHQIWRFTLNKPHFSANFTTAPVFTGHQIWRGSGASLYLNLYYGGLMYIFGVLTGIILITAVTLISFYVDVLS